MDQNNENGYSENNENIGQSAYEFKGPPKYIPPKYNRRKPKISLIALVAALCVLFGGAGFAYGVVYKGKTGNGGAVSDETSFTLAAESGENSNADGNPKKYVLETVDPETYYTVKSVVSLTVDTVVEITTETISTSVFMQQYVTHGAGSGVIITSDGYIATNNHVVEGASSIKVRMRDGSEHDAVLVGTDIITDIAVIKINAENLPVATIGNSDSLEVGDPVIAIGNPLGELGGTVTEGIISALERKINIDGKTMTLLQHSAAVNPENSGGGLFNAAGQLIGVVNAKYSEDNVEGLGFAIPAATALPVIEDIMNYGYVRGRITFGSTFVDIYSDYYVYYYRVPEYGTYVYTVERGSDAEAAGIKVGDRIDSVNGTLITESSQLDKIIEASSAGGSLSLTVTRFTTKNRKTTSEKLSLTLMFTEYKPD